MEYGEYSRIYGELNSKDDIERLEEEGYDARFLETLYTQKVNRTVKKKFHTVRKKSKEILRDWTGGESICSIADRLGYPPMLTAMTIFLEDGCSKKVFWEYVRDPSLLDSPETAAELREATEKDIVYSPQADQRQKERGKWGEGLLWEWLDGQGVSYKTEEEERAAGAAGKTPDCLLDSPMEFEGREIRWIESKASFGDAVEFRYNCKNQLIPYTELFGPGVVVYWTGHLDGLEAPDGITVEDIGIMDKKLSRI